MSDELAIPAFCVISPAERKAAWAKHDSERKEEPMKVGPKEQQLRDQKAKRVVAGKTIIHPAITASVKSLQKTGEAETVDFTAHKHPVLAVACPDCKAKVGVWCVRPSGHKAMMSLHAARKQAADAAWEKAGSVPITQVGAGKYVYDEKPTAPAAAQPQEKTMTTKTKAKAKAKPAARKAPAAKTKPKAKTSATANARKPVETFGAIPEKKGRVAKPPKAPAEGARPDGLRVGSKQAQMLDLAIAGATEKAICAELGWKKCRVTLKRVCEKVGAKLDGSTKDAEGATIWKATMPTKG